MPTCTFPFCIEAEADRYCVRLTVGGDTAKAPFEFDLGPESRISRVLSDITDGVAKYDDLRDIGSQLYLGLINGPVADLFEKARTKIVSDSEAAAALAAAGADVDESCFVLRLSLPPELQYLPWECVYDEAQTGFVLTDHRYSLVRDVKSVSVAPRAARSRLPVSMLVVIPEGSGLSIERELYAVKRVAARLGESIEVQHLHGRVTPDQLRERLDGRRWDIVHFIGHGDTVEDVARIRLNSDNPLNDAWVPGETFATFFSRSVPRLIVLNSCYGGSQAPLRTLNGIPPFLRRVGVPAVVAMQYEIADDVAIKFAETFYGELLAGRAQGQVDAALAEARRALFQNAGETVHSFATPVLYRHEDFALLFDIPAQPDAIARPVAPAVISVSAAAIPSALTEAFREQRCIPFVGPDVLRLNVARSSAPPPGPRELARTLAQDPECPYPRMDDFNMTDDPAAAAGIWPLPAVCQHYERRKPRFKLLQAVQQAYEDVEPPSTIDAIAGWDVPGIICAYFDGLVEEAMTRQHRTFRSLNGVDQKIPGYRGERLVLHLRGTFKDGESLVLTERDHEELWDRMRRLSPHITDLTRKRLGVSLLYIGVSPRDPLVRRLTHALRGGTASGGAASTQGPLFFVAPDHSPVDDAYWEEYDVQWLDLPADQLVAAVNGVARGV